MNDFCNKICKCEYAKANVFVGRQQYDRYIDHAVINKSTYIYNMYPETDELHREKIQNHAVTYIGSLVPTKGFHVLAAVWKTILKKFQMQRLMLWEMESYMVGIQNWENIILQKILMRSSLCQD